MYISDNLKGNLSQIYLSATHFDGTGKIHYTFAQTHYYDFRIRMNQLTIN